MPTTQAICWRPATTSCSSGWPAWSCLVWRCWASCPSKRWETPQVVTLVLPSRLPSLIARLLSGGGQAGRLLSGGGQVGRLLCGGRVGRPFSGGQAGRQTAVWRWSGRQTAMWWSCRQTVLWWSGRQTAVWRWSGRQTALWWSCRQTVLWWSGRQTAVWWSRRCERILNVWFVLGGILCSWQDVKIQAPTNLQSHVWLVWERNVQLQASSLDILNCASVEDSFA